MSRYVFVSIGMVEVLLTASQYFSISPCLLPSFIYPLAALEESP
jgi:hypothetical protein